MLLEHQSFNPNGHLDSDPCFAVGGFAAAHDDPRVLDALLRRSDADLNSPRRRCDFCELPAIGEAARRGKYAAVRKLAARRDVDVNVKCYHLRTPLMYASIRGDVAAVYVLLERPDLDLLAADADGLTAADHAMKNNHHEVAEMLLGEDRSRSTNRRGRKFRRRKVVRKL